VAHQHSLCYWHGRLGGRNVWDLNAEGVARLDTGRHLHLELPAVGRADLRGCKAGATGVWVSETVCSAQVAVRAIARPAGSRRTGIFIPPCEPGGATICISMAGRRVSQNGRAFFSLLIEEAPFFYFWTLIRFHLWKTKPHYEHASHRRAAPWCVLQNFASPKPRPRPLQPPAGPTSRRPTQRALTRACWPPVLRRCASAWRC